MAIIVNVSAMHPGRAVNDRAPHLCRCAGLVTGGRRESGRAGQGWVMGAVQALSCIPPSDRLTEGRPGACEGVRCPAASCPVGEPRPACPCCQCQCHREPRVGTSCQQRILWRAVPVRHARTPLVARPCRIGSGQGRRERGPHTIAHCPVSQWSVNPRGKESLGSRYGPSVSRACRLCGTSSRRACVILIQTGMRHPEAGFTYGPILFVCILKRDPGPGRVLHKMPCGRLSLSSPSPTSSYGHSVMPLFVLLLTHHPATLDPSPICQLITSGDEDWYASTH